LSSSQTDIPKSKFDIKTVVFICLAVFVAIAIVWLGLESFEKSQTKARLSRVAKIMELSGQVNLRSTQSLAVRPALIDTDLESGTKISTRGGSSVRISVIQGPQVKLGENGSLVLVRDITASISRMIWLTGELTVLEIPTSTQNFELWKDGLLIPLQQVNNYRSRPSLETVAQITALTQPAIGAGNEPGFGSASKIPGEVTTSAKNSTDSAADAVGRGSTIEAIEAPALSLSKTEASNGINSGGSRSRNSETSAERLTDSEIKSVLQAQASVIQRCYLNYINIMSSKENRSPVVRKGTIVVSLDISNSGKVSSTKIIKSDFTEKLINECMADAVKRSRFRAFTGSPTTIEYPIVLK
jgi:hypothetical protein